MKIEKIKELINSEKYDFLRTNKRLGNNIVLLTLGGSHAYGTQVSTSDVDVRGITLNTKEEILTMNCHDKPYEDKATDTTIYTLSQIITLLSNCNPNVIELMGTSEEQLFVCSEEGRLIRDNIYTFLSKRAIHSFAGYANSQLRRLENFLAKDSYPQKEKERHIMESIGCQMASFEGRYRDFTKQNIKLYLGESDKVGFDEEIYMDINLNNYPMRDFKSMYSEMSNVVKDYESLNHRNSKKDNIHLNKHILHLFRLFLMGTEILEGKGVNTYRKNDLDLLMKLRNGYYVTQKDGKDDYSLIFEMVDEYEKKFKYASDNTNLPDKPDYNKINELVSEINWGVLNGR